MAGDGSSSWCAPPGLACLNANAHIKQEGILTVLVATAAYGWVYNYPKTAKFLTEREKAYVNERLKRDSDATRDEAFTWGNVSKAFKDPKVWLYGLGFHTMSLPLYTLSLFLVSPFSPSLPSRNAQPNPRCPANHHPTTRLHSRASATHDCSPLLRRLRPHPHHRRLQRALPPPRPLHHRLCPPRLNRLYNPPLHASPPPRSLILRHHPRSRGHLSRDRHRARLARQQRLWANETRDC